MTISRSPFGRAAKENISVGCSGERLVQSAAEVDLGPVADGTGSVAIFLESVPVHALFLH